MRQTRRQWGFIVSTQHNDVRKNKLSTTGTSRHGADVQNKGGHIEEYRRRTDLRDVLAVASVAGALALDPAAPAAVAPLTFGLARAGADRRPGAGTLGRRNRSVTIMLGVLVD